MTNSDVENVNLVIKTLESLRKTEKPVLTFGDTVVCMGYNNFRKGNAKYEHGLCTSVDKEGYITVCTDPYVPFVCFKKERYMDSKGYTITNISGIDVSGGYFIGVNDIENFKWIETTKRIHQFFGHCGWTAGGAIQFPVIVNKWEYTNNDKIY